MLPLVAVITPTMNAEKTIGRALNSVLSQTHQNFVAVVIDASPNDLTERAVRSINDDRIRYLRQIPGTRGQAAARNQGIAAFDSDFITFLDADDYYEPNKLKTQVDFLLNHPEHGAVYCDVLYRHVDKPSVILEGRWPHPSGVIIRDLFGSLVVNINTLMYRRAFFHKGVAFEERTCWPEDYQLCMRLALHGCSFGYVDGFLVNVELRKGVNIPYEQMYLLKKHTADMLEEAAGQTDDTICKEIAARTVARTRRKYALACLMGGQMERFDEAARYLLPRPICGIAKVGVRLIPKSVFRVSLIAVWNMGRIKHYRRHIPAAADLQNQEVGSRFI